MTGRLAGKVAAITGAGSGIGRESALRFLAEGASVIVADLNEKRGQETVDLAAEAGNGERAAFVRADVTREEDVQGMVAAARSRFGRIDCVFNNAGVPGALGSILDISAEHWDFTMAVLVRSVFLGIKHGGLAMKEQGSGGCILNTASVAGLSGGCGPHGYTAAKAAVLNLTRSAAVELARHKIRVNAVAPGAILTPLVHRENDPNDFAALMAKGQPLRETGRGEDVAAAAVYLASDEAHFVTGAHIVIDGGMTAAGPNVYRGHWEAAGGAGLDVGSTER